MERKLLIVLILLLSIMYACKPKHFEEKTWVCTNWTKTLTPSQYEKFKEKLKAKDKLNYFEFYTDSIPIHTIPEQLILKFKKDSLIIAHFQRDKSKQHMMQSFGYTYKKDSIILTQNNIGGISFKIEQLSKEKIILSTYLDGPSYLSPINEITLEPIKKFPKKNRIEDIESFLANNKFLINNTETEVFFHEPFQYGGKITLNKSDESFDLKSHDLWYLVEIDNELFLKIGSEVIQIVTLQKDKILGYKYGEQNREISIERIAPINE